MKIIMTKGLPGSGKTTWAKEYIAKNHGTKRVNKDELRSMIDNGKWTKSNEAMILNVRDLLVETCLKEGHDVILDDTNLHSKHKNAMWKIAATYDATVEVRDFTDIDLETCIKRDLLRLNSVGEKVIRQMYNQYLKPTYPAPIHDPKLPHAIMCDLDGTLALFGDANPYDRDFLKDIPNEPIKRILEDYSAPGYEIIIVSGRSGKFFKQTTDWLAVHGIGYEKLYMRGFDDTRKDFVVKQEIYNENIKGKYNIDFVLDDRNQVVDLWRSLGLTCLQVAPGDF